MKRDGYMSLNFGIYIWAESINLGVIYLLFKANNQAMSMCRWWEGDLRPNFLVVLFTILLPYHSFSPRYTTLLSVQVNEIETQNSGSLYIPYSILYAVCNFLKLSVLTLVYCFIAVFLLTLLRRLYDLTCRNEPSLLWVPAILCIILSNPLPSIM